MATQRNSRRRVGACSSVASNRRTRNCARSPDGIASSPGVARRKRSSPAAALLPVGSPTDCAERTIRPCGMTSPSPSPRVSQLATCAPLRLRRETPAFVGERARRCVDRAGPCAAIRDKAGARRVPRHGRPGSPVSVGASSSTANAGTSVGGRSGPPGPRCTQRSARRRSQSRNGEIQLRHRSCSALIFLVAGHYGEAVSTDVVDLGRRMSDPWLGRAELVRCRSRCWRSRAGDGSATAGCGVGIRSPRCVPSRSRPWRR